MRQACGEKGYANPSVAARVTPDRALASRLNRYYGYSALWSFQIWGPFWTLWLLLFADFFEATLVDVVFWTASLLVAMPVGAFADRRGRKPALSLGIVLWAGGIAIWGFATSLPAFALASIVWAVGAELIWNTGSAYLYDTLAEVGREEDYPAVISRATLLSYLATAIASVAGGLVVHLTGDFRLTLLLYGIPGAAALGLTLTFREPTVHRVPSTNMFVQIRAGMRTTLANRQIVLVMVFQVIVTVVTYVMAFFRPAFIADLVQDDYLLMGLGYAAFACIAALAGHSMRRILERLGESGALVLTYFLVFAPFGLVYLLSIGVFEPAIALAVGLVTQASFYVFLGVEVPVVTTILNRRIPSSERATVLAIASFFSTLSLAIFEPMVGLLAVRYDLQTGLAAVGAVAAVPCAVLLIAFRRSERAAASTASTGAPILGR